MASKDELRALRREYESRGWTIRRTAGGHLRWTPPRGHGGSSTRPPRPATWAEYKLGVIATRVGAVPVGYIHYSWSTMWKIKNAADKYGSASAAVVSVACSKLPNLALRAACVALVQSYNIFTKDKINAAINAKKCLAARQAYSVIPTVMLAYTTLYTTTCYK